MRIQSNVFIGIIISVVLVAVLGAYILTKRSAVSPVSYQSSHWRDSIPSSPTGLTLPFSVKDILEAEELISPYGVIRHSRDSGIGHGGIDFPLVAGSPIYAVAEGEILKNNLEEAGGGNTVDILISSGKLAGEGWIFKYEHIILDPGLTVGSKIQKGQKIGTNGLVRRGNNHVGLEYHINNFTISRDKRCFVDFLEPTAQGELTQAFDKIKKTPLFIKAWQTANEEGYYQYKGLLNTTKYPKGPQLCYPLGTDARVTIR